MRIALIGDIHFYRLRVAPGDMWGKRVLGQTNLWVSRRRHFNLSLLPPVLARIVAIQPDLLLCPGDFTTTALHGEFLDAAAAMLPVAQKIPTVATPGNHDRYTFEAGRKLLLEQALPGLVPAEFPHLRPIGPRWHLLVLNAAIPQLVSSRGWLGPEQLAAAGRLLAPLAPEQGVVVLCHYPFQVPPEIGPRPWHHRLADAQALQDLLAQQRRPTLYLHGHVHQPWAWRCPEPLGHVRMINAGAPCLIGPGYPLGQGFWQIELPDDPAQAMALSHHARLSAGQAGQEPQDSWRVSLVAAEPAASFPAASGGKAL